MIEYGLQINDQNYSNCSQQVMKHVIMDMTGKLKLYRPTGGSLACQDKKKTRQVGANVSVMYILFFGFIGIVHQTFIKSGTSVCVKQPDKTYRIGDETIRGNCTSFTLLRVAEFSTKNNMVMKPQPAHSPDMARSYFVHSQN